MKTLKALNRRILQAAKDNEFIDPNEVPQLTNHMFVNFSLKSCHRVEVWASMNRIQLFKGMSNPQCYFPYTPQAGDVSPDDSLSL